MCRAVGIMGALDGEAPAYDTRDLAPTGNFQITHAAPIEAEERIVITRETGFIWLAAESADVIGAPTPVQTRETVYR